MPSKNYKFRYDQQQGIFVKESQITANWLLSQVLQKSGLQITKVSNEELKVFLHLLDESDIRLPNGQHALIWLKDHLKERYDMATGQQGEAWAKTADRYRYIRAQIDMILVTTKNLKEKMEIVKPEEKEPDEGLTTNNMECRFEPE